MGQLKQFSEVVMIFKILFKMFLRPPIVFFVVDSTWGFFCEKFMINWERSYSITFMLGYDHLNYVLNILMNSSIKLNNNQSLIKPKPQICFVISAPNKNYHSNIINLNFKSYTDR